MVLGGDNFWVLEDTPRAVVEGADDDDETTKDVAEGTTTAAVNVKYATDENFIVFFKAAG